MFALFRSKNCNIPRVEEIINLFNNMNNIIYYSCSLITFFICSYKDRLEGKNEPTNRTYVHKYRKLEVIITKNHIYL